jgi:uncharacterized protein YutE (UPF0331/DUF86 family)
VTELDRALVRRKLATIARNLGDLTAVEGLTMEEYRSDRFRQKGSERMLQEAVEAAVDVNLHLLRATGHPAPPDYYESFIAVGLAGVIPEDLARQLAPSAGLRNRLVHEYDVIDDAIVLDAVRRARREFAVYVAAIERYVAGRPQDA